MAAEQAPLPEVGHLRCLAMERAFHLRELFDQINCLWRLTRERPRRDVTRCWEAPQP